MLQSYSPIGKFVFLTFRNPKVLGEDTVLQNNLNNLVGLLKENIKTEGIISAEKKMEDDIFNLRFQILEYLSCHSDVLENIEGFLVDEIGKKYFTTGKYKELGKTVSDTLEIYLLMFNQLSVEIKNNISDISNISKDINSGLKLSALRYINTLQPNPELYNVIEWFAASVRYDFYLITAEFIMNNEIVVETEQLDILTNSLKSAIVDFGFYTSLSGLWTPKPDDESPLIRNIKIRAAAHRVNTGAGVSISRQNLQNILLS